MQVVHGLHGRFIIPEQDTYVGRSLQCLGEFSEGEVDLFKTIIRPGQRVIEIGANLGALTIPLARLAAEVLAIEPQRLIFQALCGSVALNDLANVRVMHAAVGEEAGTTQIPMLNVAASQNFGAFPAFGHNSGEAVPVVTLDSLPAAQVVKIDVEGAECSVIEGGKTFIRDNRPVLYVENDRAEQSTRLIRMIMDLGYNLWWHIPPLYRADNHNAAPNPWFENVLSFNMLGVPKEVSAKINLRPVLPGETHLDTVRRN